MAPAIHLTHSPDDTFDLGYDLGAALTPERATPCFVVLLEGDLGAGKTCFSKGLAAGLDIPDDEVTSPTFTIINEYRGGRLPLRHLDLYRLPAEADIRESLGLDEILSETGVMIVEWAERLGRFDWKNGVSVTIRVLGDNDREIITAALTTR